MSATSYFCSNCGKKLHEKPLSASVLKQAGMYLVSVLLPPFGLWWAVKYLRQGDSTGKKIGIAIIALTVISLALNIWGTIALYDTYSQLLNPYRNLGL